VLHPLPGRSLRPLSAVLRRSRIATSVLAIVLYAFAANPALAQKLPKPTLFVQEYSGDFKQFVLTKTIDEPENSLFSFENTLSGVIGAQWQLSSKPIPNNVLSHRFAGFLGSGELEPPAQGKAKVFTVAWKELVPAKPPQGTKYYFRVVVSQRGARNAAVVSNTVVITTQKATSSVTFTAEGLGLTVKKRHPAMYAASPMAIELDLQTLYVGNDNEDDDAPYLLVAVVYADGTTINPLAMSTSSVRIDSHTKTHGNVPDEDQSGDDVEQGSTVNIPPATGHFEKTIEPIGLDLAADLEDPDYSIGESMANGTAVYVIVVAMEEDDTTTDAINAARATMVTELQKKADEIIQRRTLQDLMSGNPPEFDPEEIQDELKDKVIQAARDESLTPGWWLAPILFTKLVGEGDRDDFVGAANRRFTFGELLQAGTTGIAFELECSNSEDWEGSYTVKGRIRRK
jgi:hypothetical protein